MNRVITVFEADARQFFTTADQVEARLKTIQAANSPAASPTNGAQAAIIQQAQAITAAVVSENGKRIAADRNLTRSTIEESEKRIAAQKLEAERIAAIQINSTRSLIPSGPFTPGKTPAQILFESGDPGARVNAGANSLRRLAGFEKQILQEETVDRVAALKAQETGYAAYYRNLTELRAKDLAGTELAEKAKTSLIFKETEKRAVAGGGGGGPRAFGRDALSVPLGAGLTARAGIGGGAEFIAGAAALFFLKEFADATEKGEDRIKTFRAELIGLGVDAAQAIQNSARFASQNNLSLDQAGSIYTRSLQLSRDNANQFAQLAADVGALRNLPAADVAKGLDDINRGLASQALFGGNANAILEIYASRLGKTASQLDDVQKRQAFVSAFTAEGTRNIGLQAQSMNTLGGSIEHIKNAAEQDTSSGAGSRAIGGIAEGFTTYGDLLAHPLSFVQAGRERRQRVDTDSIARLAQNSIDQLANASDVASANVNPQANIQNFSLHKFLDQSTFFGLSANDQQQAIQDAVGKGITFRDNLLSSFNVALAKGDTIGIKLGQSRIDFYKNLFPEDQVTEIGSRAAQGISSALKDGLQSQLSRTENIADLRRISSQIFQSSDLTGHDKITLFDETAKKIEAAFKNQVDQVKRLQAGYQSAFDSVASREGQRNGFLALLDSIDKRTTDLRRNLRGLPAEVQNALLARNAAQDSLDFSSLRFATRENALNLRDEAGSLTRFQRTGSTDSEEVNRLKRLIQERGPDDALFGDYFKKQLNDAQRRDVQNRLDAQIDIAKQSFLSGAKPSDQARSLFNEEIIKLTPLDRVDQFSRPELNQAIVSRQQEAQFQDSSEARAREEKKQRDEVQDKINSFILKLIADVEKGKGIPVDLGSQAVTVVEVSSPQLGVTKRSSTSTAKKSTADAMEP